MDAAFKPVNYPLVAIETAIVPWQQRAGNVGPRRRPQAVELIVVGELRIAGKSACQIPRIWQDFGNRNMPEPGRYVDTWV